MPGKKGIITKAKGVAAKSVYLSDVFGIWPEKGGMHITFLKDRQKFHTSVSANDGLLYETLCMLHAYGMLHGANEEGVPQGDAN